MKTMTGNKARHQQSIQTTLFFYFMDEKTGFKLPYKMRITRKC